MGLARVNLIDWHHIGQQPFARLSATRQTEDALIARAQVWAATHYAEPAPVEAIAEELGYEDASFFSRLFKREVKLTPARYRRKFGELRDVLCDAADCSA